MLPEQAGLTKVNYYLSGVGEMCSIKQWVAAVEDRESKSTRCGHVLAGKVPGVALPLQVKIV